MEMENRRQMCFQTLVKFKIRRLGLFLLVKFFFYNGNGNGRQMCFQTLVKFKIEMLSRSRMEYLKVVSQRGSDDIFHSREWRI